MLANKKEHSTTEICSILEETKTPDTNRIFELENTPKISETQESYTQFRPQEDLCKMSKTRITFYNVMISQT